ncbi:MAG: flagellar hook assembly protein FlgD [Myxococcota bacterium]|nr:flagellar hook assembly protein FlgD [Myxococcota bacterium]
MSSGLAGVAQAPYDPMQGAGQGPNKDMMGKESFLKLLVTQLSNQDPLSPAEPTEFLGQLAQFTSLEQLANVNDGLNILAISQTAATSAEMVSFVGREVTFSGSGMVLDTRGQEKEIEFELSGKADKVTVQVLDETGEVVRNMDMGSMSPGQKTAEFDGRDDDGNQLPAGSYTIQISAFDEDGASVDVSTLSKGVVSGVTFEAGYPKLRLQDGREITLNQILEVTEVELPSTVDPEDEAAEAAADSVDEPLDSADGAEPGEPSGGGDVDSADEPQQPPDQL